MWAVLAFVAFFIGIVEQADLSVTFFMLLGLLFLSTGSAWPTVSSQWNRRGFGK
jgi:hypothetical protein